MHKEEDTDLHTSHNGKRHTLAFTESIKKKKKKKKKKTTTTITLQQLIFTKSTRTEQNLKTENSKSDLRKIRN